MKKTIYLTAVVAVLLMLAGTVGITGAADFKISDSGGYSYNGIWITDDPWYLATDIDVIFAPVKYEMTNYMTTNRLVFVDVPVDAELVLFNPNFNDYAGRMDIFNDGKTGGYYGTGLFVSHSGGKVRIRISDFTTAYSYAFTGGVGNTVDVVINASSWYANQAYLKNYAPIVATIITPDGGRILPIERNDESWQATTFPTTPLK